MTENKEKNNYCEKNWKLVNFCEFDKYAIKSYCAIHNVDESLNLGDITRVDETKLNDFDLMTWGFPCTDISVAGSQKGFIDESGNKTRSGMYYEGIRILKYKQPKFSIIENVKNLVSKRFKKEFETVLSDLDQAGYNSYWKVLNAKDYGVPQNRERVIIVSIRKDIDNGKFHFHKPFDSDIRLKDLLQPESEVENKYYLSEEYYQRFKESQKSEKYPCGNEYKVLGTTVGTGKGTNSRHWVYDINEYMSTIDATTYKQPKQILVKGKINSSQDGVILDPNGISKTHTAGHSNCPKIEKDEVLRKLTTLECFRLMDFDDSAYYACKEAGISDHQMYKQTGNSIVVAVIYYTLIELYAAMPYLFDNLRVSSFFSGIGAFEVALNRLYKAINTGNLHKNK